MKDVSKLIIIKSFHTLIWLFFNAVMLYLIYAITFNNINKWVWIGLGLFLLEAIVLLVFKMKCPLTIIARKYSSSTRDNFDIYLPEWLAKYNKIIYTTLLLVVLVILCFRLLL